MLKQPLSAKTQSELLISDAGAWLDMAVNGPGEEDDIQLFSLPPVNMKERKRRKYEQRIRGTNILRLISYPSIKGGMEDSTTQVCKRLHNWLSSIQVYYNDVVEFWNTYTVYILQMTIPVFEFFLNFKKPLQIP